MRNFNLNTVNIHLIDFAGDAPKWVAQTHLNLWANVSSKRIIKASGMSEAMMAEDTRYNFKESFIINAERKEITFYFDVETFNIVKFHNSLIDAVADMKQDVNIFIRDEVVNEFESFRIAAMETEAPANDFIEFDEGMNEEAEEQHRSEGNWIEFKTESGRTLECSKFTEVYLIPSSGYDGISFRTDLRRYGVTETQLIEALESNSSTAATWKKLHSPGRYINIIEIHALDMIPANFIHICSEVLREDITDWVYQEKGCDIPSPVYSIEFLQEVNAARAELEALQKRMARAGMNSEITHKAPYISRLAWRESGRFVNSISVSFELETVFIDAKVEVEAKVLETPNLTLFDEQIDLAKVAGLMPEWGKSLRAKIIDNSSDYIEVSRELAHLYFDIDPGTMISTISGRKVAA